MAWTLFPDERIHLSQALITPLICMHLYVRHVAGLVLPHTGVLPMFSLLTVHILTVQLSLLIMHTPPVLSLLTVHILPAPCSLLAVYIPPVLSLLKVHLPPAPCSLLTVHIPLAPCSPSALSLDLEVHGRALKACTAATILQSILIYSNLLLPLRLVLITLLLLLTFGISQATFLPILMTTTTMTTTTIYMPISLSLSLTLSLPPFEMRWIMRMTI